MKILKNNKEVSGLQGFIYAFGGASVVLAIVLLVLTNVTNATITTGTGGIINATAYCAGATGNWNGSVCTSGTSTLLPNSYLAGNSMVAKIGTAPTWLGILLIVGFASLILGYFALKN